MNEWSRYMEKPTTIGLPVGVVGAAAAAEKAEAGLGEVEGPSGSSSTPYPTLRPLVFFLIARC